MEILKNVRDVQANLLCRLYVMDVSLGCRDNMGVFMQLGIGPIKPKLGDIIYPIPINLYTDVELLCDEVDECSSEFPIDITNVFPRYMRMAYFMEDDQVTRVLWVGEIDQGFSETHCLNLLYIHEPISITVYRQNEMYEEYVEEGLLCSFRFVLTDRNHSHCLRVRQKDTQTIYWFGGPR